MKQISNLLRVSLFLLATNLSFNVQSFAQCAGCTVTTGCVDFNEDDFELLTIKATEDDPMPAPVTSNCIDIWDEAGCSAGTDGINDVEITMEAQVFNPNANGTCDDDDFVIMSAIGGGPLPCPGPSGSSDFGASTTDDCVCESGFTCWTYTFKNGFNSAASCLEAPVTSSNGSTEGHEAMVFWVTNATDEMGGPVTLATPNPALIETFCNAEYNTPIPISTWIGATGPGTWAVDENTGVTNDCATSGQNGEDTGTGDNPNDNTNSCDESTNWGLAATDIIFEFKACYFFTNAPGTDCDGDGDTGVGTNPSASIGNIDVCPVKTCGPDLTCPANTDLGSFNCNTLASIPDCPTTQAEAEAAPYNIVFEDDPCEEFVVLCTDDSIPDGCVTMATTITRTIIVFDDLDTDGVFDADEESDTCVFTITIEPAPAIMIMCPANATAECSDDLTPAGQGMATATGGCGTVVITFADVNTPGSCPNNFTITRTFTATDDCGSTTCEQTIMVDDTTPPMITCPGGAAIDCSTAPDPVVYIASVEGSGDGSCTTAGEFIEIAAAGCADCDTKIDISGYSIQDNATNPPPGCCGSSIDIVSGCLLIGCLLYTSPSPRDATLSRMPSSA